MLINKYVSIPLNSSIYIGRSRLNQKQVTIKNIPTNQVLIKILKFSVISSRWKDKYSIDHTIVYYSS